MLRPYIGGAAARPGLTWGQQLKGDPYFKRYALFWQVFLWGFGGVFLRDRKATEYKMLSEQTGIPVGDIPKALRVFDVLFPARVPWLAGPDNTKCCVVKMVPLAFRGLGALQRLVRYGVKEYDGFGATDYTSGDLTKWHNALVDFLSVKVDDLTALSA